MSEATNLDRSLEAVEAARPAQVTIVLSADEYSKIRAAVHALQDATRDADIAAARAKVSVGEAQISLTNVVRELAQAYPAIDPDAPLTLGPAKERTLVVAAAS